MMDESGPESPSTGPAPSTPPAPASAQSLEDLVRYFEANRGRFTDTALADAAHAEGYSTWTIELALDQANRGDAAPLIRKRARQVVLGVYVAAYVLLVAGMVASYEATRDIYTEFGIGILTVVMSVAVLASLTWLNRRGRTPDGALAVAALLSVPVLLLLVVAGVCVATGLPIPRVS